MPRENSVALACALLVLALGSLGCEELTGAHAVYVQIGDPEPLEESTPAAPEVTPEERVHRAGQATVLGQLDLARAELSSALAEKPDHPQALFVRACLALESGDLTGAARDIASLRQALPEHAEPRMLEALLTLRREQPALGWREAFLQAWNEVGRPDFREDPLLEELWPSDVDPEFEPAWRRARAPETRLVLALAAFPPNEERARFVLQQLPSLDNPEWAMAAFESLRRDTLPEALRSQAAEALPPRLAALSAASPETMQVRLLRLLGMTDLEDPFTSEELRELEAIAALPEWRQSELVDLYTHARRHLELAGLSRASAYAFQATVGTLAGQGPYVLLKRAQASSEHLAPAERQRLGHVLWRIGSRMAAESTILEHLLGYNLMRHGAEALEDEARLQQVEALTRESREAFQASLRVDIGRWPLPSLGEAMLQAGIRDEVAHLRGFLPPAPAAR